MNLFEWSTERNRDDNDFYLGKRQARAAENIAAVQAERDIALAKIQAERDVAIAETAAKRDVLNRLIEAKRDLLMHLSDNEREIALTELAQLENLAVTGAGADRKYQQTELTEGRRYKIGTPLEENVILLHPERLLLAASQRRLLKARIE